MEYCLDTGDLEMVKKVADLYPIRCFSMNPSIAVNCLRGTGRTFLQNAKMIREVTLHFIWRQWVILQKR